MGTGYELRVIAGTVIGGANLMGGYGSAFGAVIGSAFLEVIRNALLMAGIDSNWQGAFVGIFIIIAVLVGMQTSGTSLRATIREWRVRRRSQLCDDGGVGEDLRVGEDLGRKKWR
jgi:ribose transport system permease protein